MSWQERAAAENAAYRKKPQEKKVNWTEYTLHTGNQWRQDPGIKVSEFPMPWNQRTRNSRVPLTRLNAQRGVTPAYVLPNSRSAPAFETRRRTFENNFITRIFKVVEDCLLNDTPIKLEVYSQRLQAKDCSEVEAIFLYNELIAIFVIFILYLLYITQEYSRELKLNPRLRPTQITKSYDRLSFFRRVAEFRSLTIPSVVTGSITGMVFSLMPFTGGGSFAMLIIGIAVLAGAILIPSIYVEVSAEESGAVYPELVKGRINLITFIQLLKNTMFDNRNNHSLKSVRGDLKYWGLTEAQVDYLFTVDPEPEPEPSILPPPRFFHAMLGARANFTEEKIQKELEEYREYIVARDKHNVVVRQAYEDRKRFGHTVFNIKNIVEFIKLIGKNPKVLAPNKSFNDALVRFAAGYRAVQIDEAGGGGGGAAAAEPVPMNQFLAHGVRTRGNEGPVTMVQNPMFKSAAAAGENVPIPMNQFLAQGVTARGNVGPVTMIQNPMFKSAATAGSVGGAGANVAPLRKGGKKTYKKRRYSKHKSNKRR